MQVTKSHTPTIETPAPSSLNSSPCKTGTPNPTDGSRHSDSDIAPSPKPVPRYALVTGASRVIGKEVARALAADGYNLCLCGFRHMEELQTLSLTLSKKYEILCRTFCCDLADPAAIDIMFRDIRLLNLVVNNAGVDDHTPFASIDKVTYEKIMRTNTGSVFEVCRQALPLLLAAGEGRIINISSIFGETGASGEAIYAASKGSINAFTKSLAKELAPSHIAVNAVAPGVIDTDMNRNVLSDDELRTLCERIPAGRMGTPAEIAEVVLMLARAPLFLTGQVITVDGGMT